MSIATRMGKLEGAAVADVPCAFHALADITPTPPGAELREGPCLECGDPLLYHFTPGVPRRERELSVELYGPGTLAAVTASRRTLAAMIWLGRRAPATVYAPGETFKQALLEEHGRRMTAKWASHWQTVSDEILEAAADLLESQPPDAELEALIWPEGGAACLTC